MASAIGYEAVAIGAANTTIHMNRWAAENGSSNETPNTIAGSTISLSANVGTITFASIQNTIYVDNRTISIREGASLLDSGKNSTQSTESETQSGTEVVTTETEQTTETSGAVTDEDLLNMTEEDTEPVFTFDRDETKDTGSEFSSVYTYIIYK